MSIVYSTHPTTFTEGDTLPPIYAAQTDVNGAGQDLTTYTITAALRQPDGTIRSIGVTAISLIVGEYKLEWSTGDLVEGVGQLMEIQYVDASADIQTTEKFLINVVEELA